MTGWRIVSSVVALAVWGLPAMGQAGRPEALTDLSQALQKAAAEKKLLFIQMGRPTCGNCMALKNYIRSGQLKLRDTRFVYADLNCDDKTTYQLFRSKFKVEGNMLPFVVVTDPAGRQLVSRAGYGHANEYDDLVDEAEKKMRAAGGGETAAVTPPAAAVAPTPGAIPAAAAAPRAVRTWTSLSGASLDATLVGEDGAMVILQKAGGGRVKIARLQLSEGDRAYLNGLRAGGGL